MDEEFAWLLAIVITAIVAVAGLVSGILYHEYMWLTEASDYEVCLSACRDSLSYSGVDPDTKVKCFEMCLPLSKERCIHNFVITDIDFVITDIEQW